MPGVGNAYGLAFRRHINYIGQDVNRFALRSGHSPGGLNVINRGQATPSMTSLIIIGFRRGFYAYALRRYRRRE